MINYLLSIIHYLLSVICYLPRSPRCGLRGSLSTTLSTPCEKELNNLVFVDNEGWRSRLAVNKHEVIGKDIDTRSEA